MIGWGGGNGAESLMVLPAAPSEVHDEAFRLVSQSTGQPIPDVAYLIESPVGTFTGRTGEDGMTHRVATGSATYKIAVKAMNDHDPVAAYISGNIEGC
jgi:hypothetical protein